MKFAMGVGTMRSLDGGCSFGCVTVVFIIFLRHSTVFPPFSYLDFGEMLTPCEKDPLAELPTFCLRPWNKRLNAPHLKFRNSFCGLI